MVYPLLPKLLEQLGGGVVALGAMEGTAELVASLVKIQAGRASDRSGKRGPFVIVGYALAAFARPVFAFVTASWQVVAARTVDRIGKGIRSAPRDALIGAVTPPERRGLAFGLHRAMDNMGAVLGPAIAFALLGWAKLSLRTIFALALIPGLISTLVAWRAVRGETREPELEVKVETKSSVVAKPRAPLAPGARRLLVATALFALGASADSFLMARLLDLKLPLEWIPVAWVTLQLAKSLLNVPGGALADRLGPRRVLFASWTIYALAYALFALATRWWIFWALLPLYAIHYGLGEGAEKSLMTSVASKDERGTAYGAQLAVHGAALLPANLLFGFLYAKHVAYAFYASSAFAAAGAVALALLVAEPARVTKARVTKE
jgi:MFS family permease